MSGAFGCIAWLVVSPHDLLDMAMAVAGVEVFAFGRTLQDVWVLQLEEGIGKHIHIYPD